MKLFIAIMLVMAQTLAFAQAPTVSSPTSNQTFYVGEKVEIRWQSTRPNAWRTVNIARKLPDGRLHSWIQVGAPNTGSFDWTAEQLNGSSHMVLEIADGGNSPNRTEVAIAVVEGTRPQPVTRTELKLEKLDILHWTSVAGNTYRVERQQGSNGWETIFEEKIDFTDCEWVRYPGTETYSYRVFDVTLSRAVDLDVEQGVSVGWATIPGHNYRLQFTTDLSTWETIEEGVVEDTTCEYLFYAEGKHVFFNVVNLGQN